MEENITFWEGCHSCHARAVTNVDFKLCRSQKDGNRGTLKDQVVKQKSFELEWKEETLIFFN